ncbi:hypothetical protein Y1Q_0004888 [Alligator mississippiensis]|uniref:Uncharacterized protein n=1 Tax=Alligator mississippiensis TaxID=8496 RepID=A0A151NRA5_ALLMI|nr:hypothetical protein Y1Q_0004888 [Alligator mississippiensis]
MANQVAGNNLTEAQIQEKRHYDKSMGEHKFQVIQRPRINPEKIDGWKDLTQVEAGSVDEKRSFQGRLQGPLTGTDSPSINIKDMAVTFRLLSAEAELQRQTILDFRNLNYQTPSI